MVEKPAVVEILSAAHATRVGGELKKKENLSKYNTCEMISMEPRITTLITGPQLFETVQFIVSYWKCSFCKV